MDTVCAFHIAVVAVAMTAALLAIYDGEDRPIVDPDVTVTIEGNVVVLADLVKKVTGLVDSETLHTKSVLFQHPDIVDYLRDFVQNKGSFVGTSGALLKRRMRSSIHGHSFSSHDVERAVGAGGETDLKFAHAMGEDKDASMLSCLLNSTRPDKREAAYEYERLIKENIIKSAGLQTSRYDWRQPDTPQKVRGPGQRFNNKVVIYEAARRAGERFAEVTPAVVRGAAELAAKNRTEGVDRKSMSEATATAKHAKGIDQKNKRETSKRANGGFLSREKQQSLVQEANPPRVPLGMIDLDSKRPASVEELTRECEVRHLEHPTKALRTNGKGAPKLKVVELVALLKPHAAVGGRYLKIQAAHVDSAAGDSDDDNGDDNQQRRVRPRAEHSDLPATPAVAMGVPQVTPQITPLVTPLVTPQVTPLVTPQGDGDAAAAAMVDDEGTPSPGTAQGD